MRRLAVSEITVSACGLREGVAVELFGQSTPKDAEAMALRSARAAAYAWGLPLRHEERVRVHAHHLYRLAVARDRLEPDLVRIVDVASVLHDAGAFLSYAYHPAHSAYLVLHRTLYGLTQKEQRLAAGTVDLHERYEPMGSVMGRAEPDLDRQEERTVERLGALVAVAEALSEGGDRPRITWRGSTVRLQFGRLGPSQPKLLDRAVRSFQRAFDVEVEVRGPR